MIQKLVLLIAAVQTLVAQAPIQVNDFDASTHETGQQAYIRVPNPGLFDSIKVQVTVDARGSVIAAKAFQGREDLRRQAEAALVSKKYKPFLRNGQPVAATFGAWVRILPPEIRPRARRTFPEVKDWNSVRFGLVRTTCLGSCPSYEVEIHGDGTVLFKGRRYVAVAGEHRGSISRDGIESLMALFRQADFFSFDEKYVFNATDGAAYTVSLSIDGRKHSVIDYMGVMTGMPLAIEQLEQAVDEYSGSSKWVRGNRETVSLLRAEGFDFKSEAAGILVAVVAGRGDADAVRDLIRAGVPLDQASQETFNTSPPLLRAVSNPDSEVLRLLIEAGASRNDSKVKSQAAQFAKNTDRPDALEMLLKYGAKLETK